MSFKALYIPVKGAVEVREFTDDDALRAVVGEKLQYIPAGEGQMVFDEEGKFEPKPINAAATFIMEGQLLRGDYIAGDALLVGRSDRMGVSTDVPQRFIDTYKGFYNGV